MKGSFKLNRTIFGTGNLSGNICYQKRLAVGVGYLNDHLTVEPSVLHLPGFEK